MSFMTTGQVAKEAAVNVETIRFYERKGLLAEPPRRESGYRQYSESAVDRICFIKRAQELGFSLHEIQELLELKAESSDACPEVRARAEEKITDIEKKIHTLTKMSRALHKLIKECGTHKTSEECPILEAMEGEKHPPSGKSQ